MTTTRAIEILYNLMKFNQSAAKKLQVNHYSNDMKIIADGLAEIFDTEAEEINLALEEIMRCDAKRPKKSL